MLSRRMALAGPALAGLSRTAVAQYRREDEETEVILLSADGQAASVQTANDIVARLGASDDHLHAEPARGVLESAARLSDRPSAVAAILPSVTLAYMRQSGLAEHFIYANRFIGQIGVSELHVLASRGVSELRDLAGRKVAVGPRGGSTLAAASVLLDRASVRVDPLYLDYEEALTAVLRGQIAAMMLLAPKPDRLFLDIPLSDSVHFLPVDMPAGNPMGLFATRITPEDYKPPGGGVTGPPVATLGVPLVLGVYNWSAATPMFMALARLSDLLIKNGSGLRGFDMMADVPGWQRFPPVSDWLARDQAGTVQDAALAERRPAPTEARTRAPSTAAPRPRAAPADAGTTADDKERLFRQFLDWRRNQ